MYKDIARQFYSLSAEKDANFNAHFIETKYISRLLTNESDVIFGTKGTGKTALSTALTELHKDNYLNTNTLNLYTLSFNRLLKNIQDLEELIREDVHKISRIAWKNTLLNSAIYALSQVIQKENLKREIVAILSEDGFIKGSEYVKDGDEKVNSVIENILIKIQNLPFSNKGIGKYSAEDSNSINEFPLNKRASGILAQLILEVEKTGKKIMVSIDGLDSIVDHRYESRNVIFTGLIDAVFFLSLDKQVSKAFVFKAFLPHELTIDADIKLWDSDKHSNNTHYINWSKENLKDFILKRMFKYSRNNSSRFLDVWKGFFPEKVRNYVYDVDENTFDYLLRHTLYRPRQLQKHIYEIMSNWIEQTGGTTKIQDSFIPNVVKRTNLHLAEKVSQQLSLIYFGFIPFMKSFNKSLTSMEFIVFKERIIDFFIAGDTSPNPKPINEYVDEFYIFGIFGIEMNSEQRNFNSKAKDFHFSFVNDYVVTSIYSTIRDDEKIAFAPMFREYCGMTKENGFIINPVTKDDY